MFMFTPLCTYIIGIKYTYSIQIYIQCPILRYVSYFKILCTIGNPVIIWQTCRPKLIKVKICKINRYTLFYSNIFFYVIIIAPENSIKKRERSSENSDLRHKNHTKNSSRRAESKSIELLWQYFGVSC